MLPLIASRVRREQLAAMRAARPAAPRPVVRPQNTLEVSPQQPGRGPARTDGLSPRQTSSPSSAMPGGEFFSRAVLCKQTKVRCTKNMETRHEPSEGTCIRCFQHVSVAMGSDAFGLCWVEGLACHNRIR